MNIDAFAASLILILNIGSEEFQNKIVNNAVLLASFTELGLLPAFWPPIFENDEHWNLLKIIANTNLEIFLMNFIMVAVGLWSMVFWFGIGNKIRNKKGNTCFE